MRISHFFIDRPIFAAVVSVVIVILGAVAFTRLPVAQYPEIAPPVINVSGQYPGASAEVVASTVVAPIEEQINGVENMLYVSSNSNGDGRFSIGVTFDFPILMPTGIPGQRPLCRNERSLAATSSAPSLLKPSRLINASCCGYRKIRGFGFPG